MSLVDPRLVQRILSDVVAIRPSREPGPQARLHLDRILFVGRTGMLTTNLRQLSAAGWLVAAVALTSTVLVSIPLGAWALDAIDSSTFRAWRDPIIYLLAVPTLGAAVITFLVGARLLRRLGIDVQKHGRLGAQHS